MKRCPQCEFIYEDDQSLCDMDGVLLVLDSRTLPNVHALATVPAAPQKTQSRRNRAVPAFATVILALVLGMVYYVSTQNSAPQNNFTPPSAASAVNPVPEVTPEPPPPPPAEASQPPTVEEPKREPSKQPAAAPAKKAVKTTTGANTKSSNEPKKEDDSKVGSILKKTGRILKKPFKF